MLSIHTWKLRARVLRLNGRSESNFCPKLGNTFFECIKRLDIWGKTPSRFSANAFTFFFKRLDVFQGLSFHQQMMPFYHAAADSLRTRGASFCW